MWSELKYCHEGDIIRAYFLGDRDPENHGCWHKIYTLQSLGGGKYYAAIEGWRGAELDGSTEVYKLD